MSFFITAVNFLFEFIVFVSVCDLGRVFVLIIITFFCSLKAVNSTSNHAILSTVDWLPSITGFPLKVVNPVHLCSKFPSLPADFVFLLGTVLVFKFCEYYFTFADFHFFRWPFQYILSFPKQTQSNSVWLTSESC